MANFFPSLFLFLRDCVTPAAVTMWLASKSSPVSHMRASFAHLTHAPLTKVRDLQHECSERDSLPVGGTLGTVRHAWRLCHALL
jgi:hypothetical protein